LFWISFKVKYVIVKIDINKNNKADAIGNSIAKTIIEIEDIIIKKVINKALSKILILSVFGWRSNSS
jgi:hypothetical protein